MERIWLKSYPEGVPADVNPTAYASIGDLFVANVDRYRDRTAYICMGRTMSYGELDRRRCHVVGGLVAKGHAENQLLRISVPSGDHSPGDLALSPVHA